ncbi:hypothetical protein PHLCEN_2v453 [Hermanssonia centrifuga]|uniref:Uncharacterized protein n=1 Tax=Hermanssonia centrifuga TaxID=98765 RepID=A0A2R6S632_9APHY|nr:hypothetical protein PHLCEN_2v453 [Hermanssonia centrifuga]
MPPTYLVEAPEFGSELQKSCNSILRRIVRSPVDLVSGGAFLPTRSNDGRYESFALGQGSNLHKTGSPLSRLFRQDTSDNFKVQIGELEAMSMLEVPPVSTEGAEEFSAKERRIDGSFSSLPRDVRCDTVKARGSICGCVGRNIGTISLSPNPT